MVRGPLSHEQHLLAADGHRIPQGQLATPPGFDAAVHLHITALDAQLGLPAGTHQALVLEELVEFQNWGCKGG